MENGYLLPFFEEIKLILNMQKNSLGHKTNHKMQRQITSKTKIFE